MPEYSVSSLAKLIDNFNKISGISRKTAKRIAYSILKMSNHQVDEFAESIIKTKQTIRYCKICCNFTDKEVCSICSDNARNKGIICVVEDPKDVEAFEKSKEYNFTYHVLHGTISPLNGVGPDQLCIKELIHRIKENAKEIIMACNPTVEGEATSMYIYKIIKPFGVKVTRLAYGIPIGANLEYADEATLYRAIQGRGQI
ncbi:MAG: recombination mediator RecR [Oscillospiraceae bacterium]|jgi:recombination protein RecR|nr:recombination mediator RecR [Oscillospiraceae bacterium]